LSALLPSHQGYLTAFSAVANRFLTTTPSAEANDRVNSSRSVSARLCCAMRVGRAWWQSSS